MLDPVDGTLVFVRGDQYAIALAMIEDGEVVLGVLGCPNYPMKKEWLNYHHRYYRFMSKLSPPTAESWDKGCVIYAQRGCQKAWMQPLIHDGKKVVGPNSVREIRVSSIDEPALATFCEPVEKANSSHSFTAGLSHSVGLRCFLYHLHCYFKSNQMLYTKFGQLCVYRSQISSWPSHTVVIEIEGILTPR